MIETGEGIDWATAEALAFGTLLDEGFPVRLSGQDSSAARSRSATAVLVDQENEERYMPLNHVREGQARIRSDQFAALGRSGARLRIRLSRSPSRRRSSLWEAQFGDFANGAQVIIDQFIVVGRDASGCACRGLVMLLPHGYEGQGPEHSSARLERFLQLCAEDNMQVANCTTPANYFHILRRQMHRDFRKPLILMTPKSLLRHKRAVSKLDGDGRGLRRSIACCGTTRS